jgi:hypothetical protein
MSPRRTDQPQARHRLPAVPSAGARAARSGRGASLAPVPGQPSGRYWSVRRVVAAVVSAVLICATGLLLYDVAAVRSGASGMYWRRWLTGRLAEWPVGDVWVLVGACAAMALGLLLVMLAVTPGRRSLLPMRPDVPHVRAWLDRDAAALALRDRAMEVSGVCSARVSVGRRRAHVRARSHFRPVADVHHDLEAVLGTGLEDLGLARTPRLTVHVHRTSGR